MIEKERQVHPSFAMASVHRSSCSKAQPLFGSNVKHADTMILRIHTADVTRGLSTDWHHSLKNLIEVEMSPTQFSELITKTNTTGVPVTLRKFDGKRMEEPPFNNVVEQFNKEFEEKMVTLSRRLNYLVLESNKILTAKKAPNKSEKQTMLNEIGRLQQELNANLPYMQECFSESVEKTVSEAKLSIEAYHLNKITTLGQEAYRKQLEKGTQKETTVSIDLQT